MFYIRKLTVVLMLAALGSCERPAATPAAPSPARPDEQWRSVRLPTREHCGEMACLVGLSGPNKPTIVSIRLVSVRAAKGDGRCRPDALPPGLEYPEANGEAWIMSAAATAVPLACSAFFPAANFQPWRRGDGRYPFEAENVLGYAYIPAGFSDGVDRRRIRCAIIFDPSAQPFDREKLTLHDAARICTVLFYFRATD